MCYYNYIRLTKGRYEMNKTELEKLGNRVLELEGLEQFIGEVSFKIVKDELRVYPETEYSENWIGKDLHLGFQY